MKLTAEEFNKKHSEGTRVIYWPILPPNPEFPPVETRTTTEAWTLGHGQAVVKIEGVSGGVALEHLEPSSILNDGTKWTLNKHGQRINADPDSRDAVGNQEATRDPIFLVQKRVVHLDTINGLDVNQFHHDGDTLWVDAELFTQAELAEAIAADNWRARDEDFDHDGIGVNDQTLVDKDWAIVGWRTERVFFRRPEAEGYANGQRHNLGEFGKSCRVYCVPAEGRLADLLWVVHCKEVEAFLHSEDFLFAYADYRFNLTKIRAHRA